jgi:hypothetical protein
MLASGLVAAADAHPKSAKVPKHAIHTPKTANHSKDAKKAIVHKSPKVAQRRTSTPKVAKHKPAKYQKHRA